MTFVRPGDVARQWSVEMAIDDYIDATEKPREPDGLWHPSSIFFGCDRKVIYEVRGETPSDLRSSESKRILRIGSTLHGFIQDAVANDPDIVQSWAEVEVYDDNLKIAGSADQVVLFIDGVYELQEYKTISAWGFKHLVDDDGRPAAKEEHVKQALTYVMVLREHGSAAARGSRLSDRILEPLPDLRRARITYVEKQDLKVREFVVELTPEVEREIRIKLATLESYREGPLPDRLPLVTEGSNKGKKQWQCNYCAYATTCWKE